MEAKRVTDFEHRKFSDELARCQRYFCKIENTSGSAKYFGTLQAYSANNLYGILADYPVTMRTTPTAAQSGTFGAYAADSADAGMATTIANLTPTSRSWMSAGWGTSSSLAAGNASVMYWNDGAYLTADAEL